MYFFSDIFFDSVNSYICMKEKEMFKKLDLSDDAVANDVYCIQKAAYKIEAELLGTDEIPPLQESFESLQEVDELFLGFYQGKKLVGVVSYKIEAAVLDIYRLFIEPSSIRQGIGRRLLDYVVQKNRGCEAVIVSTGEKNVPAVLFYESYGFETQSVYHKGQPMWYAKTDNRSL